MLASWLAGIRVCFICPSQKTNWIWKLNNFKPKPFSTCPTDWSVNAGYIVTLWWVSSSLFCIILQEAVYRLPSTSRDICKVWSRHPNCPWEFPPHFKELSKSTAQVWHSPADICRAAWPKSIGLKKSLVSEGSAPEFFAWPCPDHDHVCEPLHGIRMRSLGKPNFIT